MIRPLGGTPDAGQRRQPSRPAITLELVSALAPNHALAGKLCSTFRLDTVGHEGIREATRERIVLSAGALQATVNEMALKFTPSGLSAVLSITPGRPVQFDAPRSRKPAI